MEDTPPTLAREVSSSRRPGLAELAGQEHLQIIQPEDFLNSQRLERTRVAITFNHCF